MDRHQPRRRRRAVARFHPHARRGCRPYEGHRAGVQGNAGLASLGPAENWRIEIAAQRTRVYETDFDIQRGLLLGASFGRLDVTAYVLNPDESPTVVLAAAAGF
jgi:hypothetical protein